MQQWEILYKSTCWYVFCLDELVIAAVPRKKRTPERQKQQHFSTFLLVVTQVSGEDKMGLGKINAIWGRFRKRQQKRKKWYTVQLFDFTL